MKKLLKNDLLRLFLFFIMVTLVFLVCIINVKAATIDRLVYMNRTGPGFTTTFNSGGGANYTTQYIVTATNDTPNYMYAKTCSTGPLEIAVSSVSGSLSYDGYVRFGSCKVSRYNGANYVYIYSLNNFDDAGQGQRGITYSMTVRNKLSYNLFVNVHDISFSDSLDYDKALIETNQTIIDQNHTIIDQNQTIIDQNQQTNDKLDDLNDNLTDKSSPNTDGLNGAAGWLPAGPVDSLINLPLAFFNSISRDLGSSCKPVSLPLPYVKKNLTLPCMSSFYEGIKIDSFMDWLGLIVSGFILFSYLLKLYKWVDDTLTFRENNHLDNWGGV